MAHAISPSSTRPKRGEEADLAPGQSENPRDPRFCCYAVTKTETSTVFQITATTTVTFKCTPAVPILNMCTYVDIPLKIIHCFVYVWLAAITLPSISVVVIRKEV